MATFDLLKSIFLQVTGERGGVFSSKAAQKYQLLENVQLQIESEG